MVMLLFVLSSEMVKLLVVQLVVARFEFCCNTKPDEAEGHDMLMLLPECVRDIVGEPVVGTMEMRLQNPLLTEKLPPLMFTPASGWPMVPVAEKPPPVLVPPPPATLYQSTVYCWA